MAKHAIADARIPEIRFRPSAEVYAKAAQVAETLGLTVTEVARIGLTQVANSKEIRLVRGEAARSLRDIPIYGATVGRIADIAAAAGRAAYESHVRAGRLQPSEPSNRGSRRKKA